MSCSEDQRKSNFKMGKKLRGWPQLTIPCSLSSPCTRHRVCPLKNEQKNKGRNSIRPLHYLQLDYWTFYFGTVLCALPIRPDYCSHQYRAEMNLVQSFFSRSAFIADSTFSAAFLSAAVTLIYAFNFGSVPDGRITTEPLSVKNFRTSDFGRPFKPTL